MICKKILVVLISTLISIPHTLAETLPGPDREILQATSSAAVQVYLSDSDKRELVENIVANHSPKLAESISWLPSENSDAAVEGLEGKLSAKNFNVGDYVLGSSLMLVFETPENLDRLIKNNLINPDVDNVSKIDLNWLGSNAWVPSVCVNTLALSLQDIPKPDNFGEALDADFWGAASGGSSDYPTQVGFSSLEGNHENASYCEQVASGKKWVAISYSYDAAKQKARGAPIAMYRSDAKNQLVPLLLNPTMSKDDDSLVEAERSAKRILDILKDSPDFWVTMRTE